MGQVPARRRSLLRGDRAWQFQTATLVTDGEYTVRRQNRGERVLLRKGRRPTGGGRRAHSEWRRAKGKERRARGKEQRAKSEEQRAKGERPSRIGGCGFSAAGDHY